MHRRVVQRDSPASGMRREAGTLFKKPAPMRGTFISSLRERTLRSRRGSSRCSAPVEGQVRYIRQQMAACRIQVYADQVYTVLHSLVEEISSVCFGLRRAGIAPADGFRVYLDKLRQRVHKAGGRWIRRRAPLHRIPETHPWLSWKRIDGCLLADNENLHFPVERLPFQGNLPSRGWRYRFQRRWLPIL